MPDDLVFMMGKFEARFPTDRRYARNHLWALADGDAVKSGSVGNGPVEVERFRFGFSAYAVRLLQDVYFLDWNVQPPATLRERQEIGSIESSKAESALYAPMSGRLVELNAGLLSDPATINVDKYGAGWLFALEGDGTGLLTPQEYLVHLADAWKLAERTIKGQMNE